MKYNLHTHSFYCGHGSGKINEYAEYARSKGFDMLGFSEHCPFPDDALSSTRMAYSEMKSYEEEVIAERRSKPSVFLGYECDYLPKWNSYFEDLFVRVDYLISGTHFVKREDGTLATPFAEFSTKDVISYANAFIKAMETGLFLFMAHPDVFLCNYKWNDSAKAASIDILEAARSLDVPLEINANGIIKANTSDEELWGYPNKHFWALAEEYGIKAICSSDAHEVENLDKHYDDVWNFASEFKLEMVEPVLDNGKLILENSSRNQDQR